MEKNNFKTVKLGKGVMEIYDFGAVKLHAYKTNDLITDECFLLEKGGKMFMVEAPCFFDNIRELEAYIKGLSVEFVGTVIAYHGAGATFMKGAPVYSTRHADDYNHNGGGAALVKNFTAAFGDAFDSSIYATTDFIEGETLNLAGIDIRIVATQEAFDIEFPEINVVYTHMMGHDVHSIVAGSKHADAIIAQLTDYIDRGISLILTSHYTVENLEDARAKIQYLKVMKNIALKNVNPAAFKSAMKQEFTNYSGENYLDMTAGMFYK